MAFFRAGGSGGNLPNFGGTPDKTFQNNTAGTSGSSTITVTKKPRYIVMGVWSRSNTYAGFVAVVDVQNSRAYRMGIGNSGAYTTDWPAYTNYLTTISATQVVYSYVPYGGIHRVQIQIFY